MFKKIKPKIPEFTTIGQFPHCDQRILHAPGECEFCDKYVSWQDLRIAWGIAFTGYEPENKELPCPSQIHRTLETIEKWPGNRCKGEKPCGV